MNAIVTHCSYSNCSVYLPPPQRLYQCTVPNRAILDRELRHPSSEAVGTPSAADRKAICYEWTVSLLRISLGTFAGGAKFVGETGGSPWQKQRRTRSALGLQRDTRREAGSTRR